MRSICLTLGLILLTAGSAWASPAINELFLGVDNRVSDNNAEYLIDLNDPQGRGASFLDPGDLIIGSITFNTVENLSGGVTRPIGSGSVDELSAIFALKVLNVSSPGGFGPIALGPVTAADTLAAFNVGRMSGSLKAELDGWQPGTIINVYNDPALNYTRVFDPPAFSGPDDGDPGLAGADMGAGPFTAEELLLSSAYDWNSLGAAAHVMELGFTGADTDRDGAPNAGTGEGWQVFGSDDLATIRPLSGAGAFANFGVNMLVNNSGLTYQQVPGDFGGTVDVAGSSSLLGLGTASSPYDAFSNTDVVLHPVPEPATLALAVVGLFALGIFRRRRNR